MHALEWLAETMVASRLVAAIAGMWAACAIASDPVFLISKTAAIGGIGHDRATDLAVDANGNAFVAGVVGSYNFPGLDTARYTNGGVDFRFVARIDARGGAPAFVAVVGLPTSRAGDARYGNFGRDEATGLALDAAGNSYLVAYDGDATYPSRGGQLQPASGSKYVFKVDATGNVLRLSAPLDPAIRRVGALALDPAGNLYLTGSAGDGLATSVGASFPTASVAPGCLAPYVVKLDPTGQIVKYATYLGVAGIADQRCGGVGPDGNFDPTGFALAVDGSGNVLVTGQAEPGFAATAGAVNVAPTLGIVHFGNGPAFNTASHAFVAKVNPTGALAWAVRLGGDDHDRGTSIAVDPSGAVYVGGKPAARAFPAVGGFGTAYPYVTNHCLNATPELGFVAKITPDGSRIVFSGFVPAYGTLLDRCFNVGDFAPVQVVPDELGNAIVTGSTSSSTRDFEPSTNALEPIARGYSLLMVVSGDGRDVLYATSFAGNGTMGVARDRWGNVVTVDRTAVLRILSTQSTPLELSLTPNPACAGQPIAIDAHVAASYDMGTVMFAVDGATLGSVAVADGAARAGTTLAAGVHQFKATYSGAGAFDGYSSIVYYLAVNQAGACE